ncbi:MAG: DNA polymerase I [Chloroflexi bacterium]|nr:DNA polymerase I [Chloroflexota bacterium]
MAREKPLFVVFDGHAIVHRAYHAFESGPRPTRLTVSKTGEIVSAVYGFAQMLLKVLTEFKPTHFAIAFDLPTPTFRHQRYAEYKAHRPPAPDELRAQFNRVKELVQVFRIPVFEKPGFEADDIIGTLAREATARGMETLIVTGDTDTLQLVSPVVKVLYPRPRGTFSDTIVYDETLVREKYDVAPSQLPDLKGFAGETSDNIPGVPGIGEKTALKLVQQFGSVEATLEHLEEVEPPKLRETLRTNAGLARESKKLATIVTEVPIEFNPEDCAVTGYDRQKVVELFRELEFSNLLPKLPEAITEPAPVVMGEKPKGSYRAVKTTEDMDRMLADLSAVGVLAVDVETSGRSERDAELVGISLACRPGEAYYIPVGHRLLSASPQLPLDQVVGRLRPILESPALPKAGHNARFDMTVLSRYGVRVFPMTFDTMIAAHILGERSLGLKALAFSKLAIEMTPITALIGTGAKQLSMAQVDVDQVVEYAAADADVTLRLKGLFEAALHREKLWQLFADVEMPLVPILLEMEQNGVALDVALLRELAGTLGSEMDRLEGETYAEVGHQFNINSPAQLGQVLFEEKGLAHGRKTRGGSYSTDASVLEELKGNRIVDLILEYRELAKLKSTYADALLELVDRKTGRVHTTFNQTGTATGRLSSSEPNLQNIPVRGDWGRKIRQAIVAAPGNLLLAGDYSQIDLRVLAHLSQDPALVAAFRRDEDIHRATASLVFGVPVSEVTGEQRRVAKTINFGVIYGMSGFGLEQATELTREQANQFIKAYFEKYPGITGYVETTKDKARNDGYVATLLGRRRYIPEINSANRQIRESAERMAVNMPVQGTSADIIKVAMIHLYREMKKRGLRSRMTLQVHDELVFDVPPEEMQEMKRLVLEIMPRALELSVPIKVDIKTGKNWAEME